MARIKDPGDGPNYCPQGGCSKGVPLNIMLPKNGCFGVIYCEAWRDVSWHPISRGRLCPFPIGKRPEPHWWEGKDEGVPFPGWEKKGGA